MNIAYDELLFRRNLWHWLWHVKKIHWKISRAEKHHASNRLPMYFARLSSQKLMVFKIFLVFLVTFWSSLVQKNQFVSSLSHSLKEFVLADQCQDFSNGAVFSNWCVFVRGNRWGPSWNIKTEDGSFSDVGKTVNSCKLPIFFPLWYPCLVLFYVSIAFNSNKPISMVMNMSGILTLGHSHSPFAVANLIGWYWLLILDRVGTPGTFPVSNGLQHVLQCIWTPSKGTMPFAMRPQSHPQLRKTRSIMGSY